MLPYINPNYFNQQQYQPMYQVPQMQQPIAQPQIQQPMSNQYNALGKVVESVDVVKTLDIPMDGQTYYFPKADGKEIYAKQWLPNGTTKVISYLPHIEQEEPNTSNLPLKELESRFDALEDALASINENINKLNKPVTRKKVDADES